MPFAIRVGRPDLGPGKVSRRIAAVDLTVGSQHGVIAASLTLAMAADRDGVAGPATYAALPA